jgi:hypothetical protein
VLDSDFSFVSSIGELIFLPALETAKLVRTKRIPRLQWPKHTWRKSKKEIRN